MSSYTVSLDIFSGPLELLLELIERRKLLINEVSLAEVTDDYLSHLNEANELPLSERAQFVVVASTLLLIKSRSLLPMLSFTEEESESMADLERRLSLFKIFRDASKNIERTYNQSPLFPGRAYHERVVQFAPAGDVSLPNLKSAIESVLKALPSISEAPEAVVKTVISLEDMIERLRDRVSSALSTSFREFIDVSPERRPEIIIGFLALLELVKEGIVAVEQRGKFDDIMIESEDISTPKYS